MTGDVVDQITINEIIAIDDGQMIHTKTLSIDELRAIAGQTRSRFRLVDNLP